MIKIILAISAIGLLFFSMYLYTHLEGKVNFFFRLPIINLFVYALSLVVLLTFLFMSLLHPCIREYVVSSFINKYFKP